MDVLIARTASGALHGVSCANPPGFAEAYSATMERQGCTVEQISMDEWAKRQRLSYVPVGKGGDWTPPETPDIQEFADAVQETSKSLETAPLPDIGADVIHPQFGAGRVTHVLTYPDGEQVAVGSGRGWTALLREWQFAPSPLHDAPPPPAPAPEVHTPAPEPAALPRPAPDAPPKPPTAALLSVTRRVRARKPLNRDDHAADLWLMGQGYLRVTPVLDRRDPCPYFLTPAGEDATDRVERHVARQSQERAS